MRLQVQLSEREALFFTPHGRMYQIYHHEYDYAALDEFHIDHRPSEENYFLGVIELLSIIIFRPAS